MKILSINTLNTGSTGRIMRQIADKARKQGHEVILCYPHSRTNVVNYQVSDIYIVNRYIRLIGAFLDYVGCYRIAFCFSTYLFLRKVEEIKPDVVHLHNLHGSYINLYLLFKYLKKRNVKVIWTLHDCWPFTGHCGHYITAGCDKWINGCYNCPRYKDYPSSFFDDSRNRYRFKSNLFNELSDLTLVPVSKWLANQCAQSFLREKKCVPIYNGIDVNTFSYSKSDLKYMYGLQGKFVAVGLATSWGEDKGFSDYMKLADLLSDDEVIIMVGLTDEMKSNLPQNVIGMSRTDSLSELVSLYSSADVLLSLSKAETFGLTIVEAMACGTPVIVYDNTAQTELILPDTGFLVETGSIESVYQCMRVVRQKGRENYSRSCRKYVETNFSDYMQYGKYVDLYETSGRLVD